MQASGKFVDWMRGRRRGVCITGATGWLGRAMAHMAVEALSPGCPVDLRLYGSRPGALAVGGRILAVQSLAEPASLDGDAEWLVLHLALAGPGRHPGAEALRAANDALLDQALRLARSGGRVRRLVFASSGAVYRMGGPPERQAYAAMKRDQEARVGDWAAARGAPLLTPRIFNLGGPYLNHAHYAIGSLIRQALEGGGVDIQAAHPVIRSYVHVLELARVTLDLAVRDEGPACFDTAGTEAVELAELARAVGEALGLAPLAIRRPPVTGAPDRYLGDGGAYQAALAASGAKPLGLARIVRDTAAWLRTGA